MPNKALEQHLNELHEELESAGDLDPALRRQLRHVADDIEMLLAQENATAKAAEPGGQLEERVRRATVDFETEHPRLARILSDVADALTKLGI